MQHHVNPANNPLSYLLLAFGAVMLCMAVALVWRYGSTGYFALTGRPWQWAGAQPGSATAVAAPTFSTSQSIGATTLAAGQTQTITISATASATTSATIKAWVTSPRNKQVWRSPDNTLTHFATGVPVNVTYQVPIPAGWPAGTYQVSFLINSADEDSDYVTKDRFAEFSVQ